MKLDEMSREELAWAYDTHLKEAFPPSELKPLRAMERLMDREVYDPLCLRDDSGTPLGFLLLWWHRSGKLGLIDYLCVPAALRSRGIGAAMLRGLRSFYLDSTLFLAESEALTGDPARDALIARRLAFYQRCGARLLPYDCALFGVHFRTLLWGEGDSGEVLRMHQEIYQTDLGKAICDRYIQLPLAPGEAPIPAVEWTEEV